MTVVPPYLARIPMLAPLVRREVRRYERRHGRAVDFAKGWWHPPVDPVGVLASEAAQIRETLHLNPIVSITDHDNIDAGIALGRTQPPECVPLSFEWTVPFGQAFFHLGVHNLPQASAGDLFAALVGLTSTSDGTVLRALLEALHHHPDTLIVFNHPLWDLAGLGHCAHLRLVQQFLVEHGARIHAVELNGYRSWEENMGAVRLAAAFSLPVISGGDRHGRAPNSLLNLTTVRSFGDFASEVREDHRSVILVMPEYRRPLVGRKLTTAGEAMREYPSYPSGQRRWTDRVSYEWNGVVRPLSDHWANGGPWWVRVAVRAFTSATTPPVLPMLRLLVWAAGISMSADASPVALSEALDTLPQVASSYIEMIG